MIIINPNASIFILLFLIFFSFSKQQAPGDKKPIVPIPKYALAADWPRLPEGFNLSQPTGIGIDSDENIFIFHRAGRQWTTPFPDSLISMNTVLLLENKTGKILNSWGAGHFIMPHGLTVDNNNNVWVTDVALHQVFKFSHTGKLLMKKGIAKIAGTDSLHFNLPTDVAVAEDGSFYVSDGYGNSRVIKFSSTGAYQFEWGTKGKNLGEFDTPHGITLDARGNVYVADRQNNRIQVFDARGKFLKELKNNLTAQQLPSLTMAKSSQILYAVDYDFTTGQVPEMKGSTIFAYDPNGDVLFQFGRNGDYDGPVCWYHDIAVDKSGNIFTGDILGRRIQKFIPTSR